MTLLELPGDPANAFDHLAAYGLAAIIESTGTARPRLAWTDDLETRLTLDGPEWDAVGRLVHQHALDRTASTSWVMANGQNNGGLSGLFSPRVKVMDRPEVERWYAARHAVLDTLGADRSGLDLALVGALGEPSYWSFDRDEPRPDHGASRWEMKTRNRGEEFVTNRLRRLARAVADRSPAAVVSGLRGETLVDEVGKNQLDSRTPTGLMPPRPVDNARAWCALWGIALFPVFHRRLGASRTAGHIGHHSQGWLYAPLMTNLWPLARLRSVLVSSQLLVVSDLSQTQDGVSDADRDAAWSWLRERGAPAVVRFSVHRSPNKSAPEKWAERGEIVLAR